MECSYSHGSTDELNMAGIVYMCDVMCMWCVFVEFGVCVYWDKESENESKELNLQVFENPKFWFSKSLGLKS